MLYAIYIAFLKNCCSHGLLRERFWPYKVARMYSTIEAANTSCESIAIKVIHSVFKNEIFQFYISWRTFKNKRTKKKKKYVEYQHSQLLLHLNMKL